MGCLEKPKTNLILIFLNRKIRKNNEQIDYIKM